MEFISIFTSDETVIANTIKKNRQTIEKDISNWTKEYGTPVPDSLFEAYRTIIIAEYNAKNNMQEAEKKPKIQQIDGIDYCTYCKQPCDFCKCE